MANWKELLSDIVQTGPSNIKKLMEVAERLPSDQTLKDLNETAQKLIPLIPKLESLLGDGNSQKLLKLAERMPDSATIDRLAAALPVLKNMPDKVTINKLLDKASSLESFLKEVEKI